MPKLLLKVRFFCLPMGNRDHFQGFSTQTLDLLSSLGREGKLSKSTQLKTSFCQQVGHWADIWCFNSVAPEPVWTQGAQRFGAERVEFINLFTISCVTPRWFLYQQGHRKLLYTSKPCRKPFKMPAVPQAAWIVVFFLFVIPFFLGDCPSTKSDQHAATFPRSQTVTDGILVAPP